MVAAGQRLGVLEPHHKVLGKDGRGFSGVLSSCANPSPENEDWHAQKSASNSILIEQKTVQTPIRQRTGLGFFVVLLLLLCFVWFGVFWLGLC